LASSYARSAPYFDVPSLRTISFVSPSTVYILHVRIVIKVQGWYSSLPLWTHRSGTLVPRDGIRSVTDWHFNNNRDRLRMWGEGLEVFENIGTKERLHHFVNKCYMCTAGKTHVLILLYSIVHK
jgi:hypothetical protein